MTLLSYIVVPFQKFDLKEKKFHVAHTQGPIAYT